MNTPADLERLEPGARAMVELASQGPPLSELTLPEARAAIERMAPHFGSGDVLAEVFDTTCGADGRTRDVRVYVPSSPSLAEMPPMLYLHGGGWATGDLDTAHALCARLSARFGCVVASLDYRLAPEHPFPAAAEDVAEAAAWLSATGADLGARPGGAIAVGGDSAGGNLAAAFCAANAANGSIPVELQLLISPALDPGGRYPSSLTYASGYFVTQAELEMWFGLYRGNADGEDPRITPVRASSLTRLPPTVVVTAECDPTRDAAELYAARLRKSQVPVSLHRFTGQIHDFLLLADMVPESDAATTLVARIVADSLHLSRLAKGE